MFRPKIYSKRVFFEDLTPKIHLHYVPNDDLTEEGDHIRGFKAVMRDTSMPFTPQSGNDVNVGNLSYAMRHNLAVTHQPEYLTLARSGNPLELFLASQKVADAAEKSFNQSKKTE